MNNHTIQTMRTSNKTAECDLVILRETSTTRIVFRPQIVENLTNPAACINGSIFHQKKNRNGI